MLGIPVALFLSNATEWVVHKYVLHGLGAKRNSFWSFHWHEHHRNSRRNGFHDQDYERSVFGWNAQGKEALALVALGLTITPLVSAYPWFVLTSYYAGFNYYRRHRRAHCDPVWARRYLRWHYDHHMGPDQHANWCVTRPWFDSIMGTRRRYAGTERELRDARRREEREHRDGAGIRSERRVPPA